MKQGSELPALSNNDKIKVAGGGLPPKHATGRPMPELHVHSKTVLLAAVTRTEANGVKQVLLAKQLLVDLGNTRRTRWKPSLQDNSREAPARSANSTDHSSAR